MKEPSNLLVKSIRTREKLLTQSAYLGVREGLAEDIQVRQLIHQEKLTIANQLQDLERQMKSAGLPLYKKGAAAIFGEVNGALNEIDSPGQLLNWIMGKAPGKWSLQMESAYRKNQTANPRLAGKWIGQFISEELNDDAGEFCIGICQIGAKVFGYGAFLDGLYADVFVKGLADEDEIQVEVSSDAVRLKSFFNGQILEEAGKIRIAGTYRVDNGFDAGRIESVIEKGVSKLSRKGEKLVLFAELRKTIASGESGKLVQALEKLEEPGYEQEITLQTHRLNSLHRRHRMGLLAYSEFQLEETKIVYAILNLISDIESNYRNY